MDSTIEATPPSGPAIGDAFLADRMAFWGRFTRLVTRAAIGIAVLLILMAIFLT